MSINDKKKLRKNIVNNIDKIFIIKEVSTLKTRDR